MDIIEMTRQLDAVVEKYDLREDSEPLKSEHSISKAEQLKQDIEKIEKENRLLRIGIVGRVKAGKSSLLNALIFEGNNVLPKAATPMTAALTILEYSEQTKAEVEFYSKEDLADIESDYHRYKTLLEKIIKEKYDELLRREQRKARAEKQIDSQKLRIRAERQAKNEIRSNTALSAAYDHYKKIKESNFTIDEKETIKDIKAVDIKDLYNKLNDYVGANGKYMPFTKSVKLKLNEDNLKDIQIIDTPGLNDPVASREERTRELLKYCDVIFIVSPSGQFLSKEDMDLFDRITSKEGVKEIYVIATQVDNQLFGSENKDGILRNTLNRITSNLTNHLHETLEKNEVLKDNPTFKKLTKNDVVYSSSIAYSLMKKIDHKDQWDESEKHVWNNLNTYYRDFFDNRDSAVENLMMLANIESIKDILNEVKLKKDKIIKQRSNDYITTKLNTLLKYKEDLIKVINDKLKRLQHADLDELRKQKNHIQNVKDKALLSVKIEFDDIIERLEIDLTKLLIDKLNSYFQKTRKDIVESEGTKTETWTVSVSKWWNPFTWGKKETRSRTYTIVPAGHVRNALEELTDTIESTIENQLKEYILQWKRDLNKPIISVLRREVGDENIDIQLMSLSIRKITNSIYCPDINYTGNLPRSLKKSGTLKENEAEQFLNEAINYVAELRRRVKNDIIAYISNLIHKLRGIDIAADIFKDYNSKIESLENDIKNKELVLDRYNRAINDLKAVQ